MLDGISDSSVKASWSNPPTDWPKKEMSNHKNTTITNSDLVSKRLLSPREILIETSNSWEEKKIPLMILSIIEHGKNNKNFCTYTRSYHKSSQKEIHRKRHNFKK